MPTHRRQNVRFGAQLPSGASTMPAHRHRAPVEGLVHEIEVLTRGFNEQKDATEVYRAEHEAQAATQANTIALLQEQVQKQASVINNLKTSQKDLEFRSAVLLQLHKQNDQKIVTLFSYTNKLEEDFSEAKQHDDEDIERLIAEVDTTRHVVRDLVGAEMAMHAAAIIKLEKDTRRYADHNSEVRKAFNKSIAVLDERTIEGHERIIALNGRIDSISQDIAADIKPEVKTHSEASTELPTGEQSPTEHKSSFKKMNERVDYHDQCIRDTRQYITFTLKPEIDSMQSRCKDIAKFKKSIIELEKTATNQNRKEQGHRIDGCEAELDSCADIMASHTNALRAIEEIQEGFGQAVATMMRRLDRLDWDEGRLLQSDVSRAATPEPGSYDDLTMGLRDD